MFPNITKAEDLHELSIKKRINFRSCYVLFHRTLKWLIFSFFACFFVIFDKSLFSFSFFFLSSFSFFFAVCFIHCTWKRLLFSFFACFFFAIFVRSLFFCFFFFLSSFSSFFVVCFIHRKWKRINSSFFACFFVICVYFCPLFFRIFLSYFLFGVCVM